uniref:PDZ domain-containing protein n=1 Tax=Rhabditophanes sp. KR3021 TaxID=114890 RepID=A0AC35UE50_9BILA
MNNTISENNFNVFCFINDDEIPLKCCLKSSFNYITLDDFYQNYDVPQNVKYFIKELDESLGKMTYRQLLPHDRIPTSHNNTYELYQKEIGGGSCLGTSVTGSSSGSSTLNVPFRKINTNRQSNQFEMSMDVSAIRPLLPKSVFADSSKTNDRRKNKPMISSSSRYALDASVGQFGESLPFHRSTNSISSSSSDGSYIPVERSRKQRTKKLETYEDTTFNDTTYSSFPASTVFLNAETIKFSVREGQQLGFGIDGDEENGIYVTDLCSDDLLLKGLSEGDLIIEINGYSFDQISLQKADIQLENILMRFNNIEMTFTKSHCGDITSTTVQKFRDESVYPINTSIWAKQADQLRGSQTLGESSYFNNSDIEAPYLTTSSPPSEILKGIICPKYGVKLTSSTWFKLNTPMSFTGVNLVEWLRRNVKGISDKKEAKEFAYNLLRNKFIVHPVSMKKFVKKASYSVVAT